MIPILWKVLQRNERIKNKTQASRSSPSWKFSMKPFSSKVFALQTAATACSKNVTPMHPAQ